MKGLVVLALMVGYDVFMYDKNPVVLLGGYAPNLYLWHFWGTIAGQAYLAVFSLVLLVLIAIEKDKNNKEHCKKLFTHFFTVGIDALIGGICSIMASSLLVKATRSHPTEFNQISTNMLFTIGMLYAVTAWQAVGNSIRPIPKKSEMQITPEQLETLEKLTATTNGLKKLINK